MRRGLTFSSDVRGAGAAFFFAGAAFFCRFFGRAAASSSSLESVATSSEPLESDSE